MPTVSTCSSMMSISIFIGSSSASILGPRTRKPVAVGLFVSRRLVGGWQEVAGDLLLKEPVVRLVLVEGGHHVVAIPPGLGVSDVLVHPVGVGVPGQVEPVPPPPFAVSGRPEQAVDGPLEGLRRLVGQESGHFLGGGGKSGEVERRAADQGPAVGGRGLAERLRLQSSQDEAIDRRSDPALVLDGGEWRLDDRLERPERLLLGRDRRTGCGRRGGGWRGRWVVSGPGGSGAHPLCERRQIRFRELSLGGHLEVAGVANRLDQ